MGRGRKEKKKKKKKRRRRRRKKVRVVDWLELEKDTLELIATRLTVLVDFIRFGAVCKTWRSIFLENRYRPRHQLPVLMIPGEYHKSFFSLSEKRTYRLKILPDKDGRKWCCGSSEGHLIMVDLNLKIFFLNPFSGIETPLPLLTTVSKFIDVHETNIGTIEYTCRFPIPDRPTLIEIAGHMVQYVYKAIAAGPYIIAILSSRSVLAFCKLDSDAWTYMNSKFVWEDIVCYNGNFYVISSYGRVGVLDVSRIHPILTMVPMIVGGGFEFKKKYLVESSGQLLMVGSIIDGGRYEYLSCGTTSFKIFRVDVNNHLCFPLKALGDGMLFLGQNCSMSLSARDFFGCEGNCIYFIDDECYCLRVYNVEDGSFKELYNRGWWKWLRPRLSWLTPSLW